MEANVTIAGIVYIITVIVPGVFFKRFYFQGQFSKQFGSGLFADRIITSLFWGIIVQLITLLIFSKTLVIKYDNITEPFSAAYDQLLSNQLPDFSTQNLLFVLAYILASIFISGALGHILHKIIRGLRIDIKFLVFRFSNHWYYYFSGDILRTKDFKGSRKGKVLFSLIDLVVNNGESKTKMISGYITQFTTSANGELETLYLTEARRYSHSENKFKFIPGDCFVVPYKHVLNMNITYVFEELIVSSKRKEVINSIFNIVAFILFFSIFIAPWYLEVIWWKKILGIVVLLISWTLMTVFGTNMTSKTSINQETKTAAWISFVLSIVFLIGSIFLLELNHSIWSWIKMLL